MLPQSIHAALATALAAKGYDELTPVQLAVLGEEAAGRDLLVSAQTGSGKTVAFGMAIAPTLLGEEASLGDAGAPMALLIAPTRELALQVQRELQWLYAEAGAKIAAGVGGMDIRTERRALERGAHIVVGTPGRLRDHITKGALDLTNVRAVVLDEADEMLDLGFREDLEFILAAAPEGRRTLLFSATVPKAIAELAQSFQQDALRLTVTAAHERHADIDYVQVIVRAEEKEHAIINTLLLYDDSNTIVFCHTREATKHLSARLANRGFAVVHLSGELTQAERSNALQAMRDGRARICVATDVAARGIDLPNLNLVIHADIPSNPETLTHRSGRTGRAGRKGTCVLIVPMHRRKAVARTLGYANIKSSERGAPTIAEIDRHNHEQMLARAQAIMPPDENEAALVAELMGLLTPEQLAAAWLRGELARRPAAEDVSEERIPPINEKPVRKRFEDGPAREFEPREPRARREPMQGGRWFVLPLGRKQRADPKWLLPMICKAGNVVKADIGSIKIGELETRFEIAADKADAFAEKVAKAGGEAQISPASGDTPPQYREQGPRREFKPRADRGHEERPRREYKPREEGAPPRERKPAGEFVTPFAHRGTRQYKPREDGPRYKVRTDKGGKLDSIPANDPAPAIVDADRPRASKESKPNPKDKGKPKYKNRVKPGPRREREESPPADAGDKPRKKKSYDPLD
jgi:ATP-dependent RNA helicase DeaD